MKTINMKSHKSMEVSYLAIFISGALSENAQEQLTVCSIVKLKVGK